MTKSTIIIIALLAFFKVNAQNINFPDANLKARLLASDADNQVAKNLNGIYFAIDADGDGEINQTEAAQVSFLNAKNSSIINFEGIAHFSNMSVLDCSWNGGFMEPIVLNLSGMPNLKKLICYENNMTPDISSFSNLEELHLGYCTGINSIDLTNFTNLKIFDCSRMHINALNVNGLTNLEELYFSYNEINEINLSTLSNIKILVGDFTNIPILNLSNLAYLETFTFRYTPLVSLNLNGCSSIKNILANNNLLTTLDVSGLAQLEELRCSGSNLSSLNLTGCTNLQFLDCSISHLTTLNASNLPNLAYFNCANGLLQTLNISNSSNIKYLHCQENQLTSLDCNELTQLEILYCENNPLVSLHAKNTAIETTINYGLSDTLQYVCVDDAQVDFYQFHLPNPNCIVDSACSTLANTEFIANSGIRIYPNPTYEVIHIDSGTEKITAAQIFNNLGQLVMTFPINATISKVNVAGLSAGNYFIRMDSNSGTVTRKFIRM